MTDRLNSLLESLRRGEQHELELEQIEALIGWLSGSSRRESTLPVKPDHDPVLVLLVLQQLDRSLFKDYRLNPEAAGLGPEQPMAVRRMRFRRLAGVFHPDRFPDLADWLTVRSQAVHHAYARFKQDPDAWLDYDRPERPIAATETRNPAPAAAPRPARTRSESEVHRWLMGLRARFGHDRRLPHKLIAGLALIAALPVANLYLAPAIPQPSNGTATAVAEPQITSPAAVQPAATTGATRVRARADDTPAAAAEIAPPAAGIAGSGEDPRIASSPAELSATPAAAEPERPVNKREPSFEQRAFGPSVQEQMAALGLNEDRQDFGRSDGGESAIRTNGSVRPAALSERASADPVNASLSDPTSRPDVADEDTANNRPAAGHSARLIALNDAPGPANTVTVSSPASTDAAMTEPDVNATAARPPTTVAADDAPATPVDSVAALEQTRGTDLDSAAVPQSRSEHSGRATPEAPEPGVLVLGPLKRHAVGRLLSGYQSHVQSGNLAALMALFSSAQPRQSRHYGRDALADYYRTLFRRSSQRTLDLRVIRMQRADAGWRVETELDFSITVDDGREQIVNGRAQFHIQPDRGALKIDAIDY